MFKKNESTLDRIIRLILAIVFFVLAMYWADGVMATVLYVLAAVMLVTSALGFCGLYAVLGFGTCKVGENKEAGAQATNEELKSEQKEDN